MIESGGIPDQNRETSSAQVPERNILKDTAVPSAPITPVSKENYGEAVTKPENHQLFSVSSPPERANAIGEISQTSKKEVSEAATSKEKPPRHPEMEKETHKGSVDPYLDSLVEKNKNSLGAEGAGKVIEAGKRFDEKYEGELKGILAKVPDVVDAAHEAKLDSKATQDLLLHTINAPKGEFAPRNSDNLNALTRGLEYSAAHKEILSDEDAGALKGMVTVSSDKNVISEGLHAYEAGRMAGLPLGDSVDLVKTVTDHVDPEMASHEVSRFGNTLKTLHLSDADPGKVKKIFTEVAQLPSEQDRKYAHSDFREGIDNGLKVGEKPKAFIDIVASKMDAGLTVNDALFSEVTRLEELIPQHETKEGKSEKALAERREELQRKVDKAFANPKEAISSSELGHSDETVAQAKTSFVNIDAPDMVMVDNSSAQPPDAIHRVTVHDPEEYRIVMERASKKLAETHPKGKEQKARIESTLFHEGEHAGVAARANAVRDDTNLKIAYNVDITTDPKVGIGINPYVAITGTAPLGVFREFIRGPHSLSPADKITLGIHPHKHTVDES